MNVYFCNHAFTAEKFMKRLIFAGIPLSKIPENCSQSLTTQNTYIDQNNISKTEPWHRSVIRSNNQIRLESSRRAALMTFMCKGIYRMKRISNLEIYMHRIS